MSDISPESIIGRKLSPEEQAEWREALEDGRSDNSGGFARPSRVNPGSPTGHNSKPAPAIEGSEMDRDADSGADTFSLEQSKLAIRAIKLGVDPLHLLVPRTTLENAVVNEEGNVVPPDVIEADIEEDYDGGYFEADYRELVGQETEDVEDLDDEDGVVRQSGNKTFIPDDDFIGLVGAKEVDGDVLPDDDDPLNGPIAA